MDLERDVERRLTHLVEQAGGICLKHGQDGWPDRIVMLPGGKIIWVELKRRVGVIADLQRYRAIQLAKVGQQVVVLRSVSEVNEFMIDQLEDE